MRGDPHSYQSIAHEDPGYWPSECEECHEAYAVEILDDRNLCAVCFDEAEEKEMSDVRSNER